MSGSQLGAERELTAVRQLTAAQSEHLRRLYLAFEQAQTHLNDFVTYLMAEHGVTSAEGWQLAPDLDRFVLGAAEARRE